MLLLAVGMVAAQSTPSATRALDKTEVSAGDPVVVTITASGISGQGVITETLPTGFTYTSSSLPANQVRPDRNDSQKIHFVLADSGDSPFTYTVTVSQAGSISGMLIKDRVSYPVTGDSSVTIQQGTTGPSATRALDKTMVANAGDPVVVTITASDISGQGVVTETLPMGFTYVSSSLAANQVRPDANDSQIIRFVIAESGDNPFTYTVNVSQAGSISGTLTKDRVNYPVTGDSSVMVQQGATTGPSATRALDNTTVTAGETVTATITASDIDGQGVVTETLSAGLTYVSSSLPARQVRPDPNNSQIIRFVLVETGDSPFTYTMTASQAGSQTISGSLTKDRVDYSVTGDGSVTVQQGSGPGATRALSTTALPAAGGSVIATITVVGPDHGVVTETLPTGFTYVSSSLPASQVRPDTTNSQIIRFVLVETADNPFTYTVSVTQAGSISGILTSDRVDYTVTGAASVSVGAVQPTPRPTPPPSGSGGQPQANRSPVFYEGGSATRSIAENSPAGTAVGDPVTARDRDDDDLEYRLTGSDADLFDINVEDGQISVAEGTTLDYEARNSYEVTVRASDPTEREDDIDITIRVTNVDEAGEVMLSPEPPMVGTELTASVTDPDGSVSNVSWKWERSADNTTWSAIVTARTYTPVEADAGYYLRVSALYTDGQGENKSAMAAYADADPGCAGAHGHTGTHSRTYTGAHAHGHTEAHGNTEAHSDAQAGAHSHGSAGAHSHGRAYAGAHGHSSA